jgi:DNA-binding NtrC family response regulator
VDVRIIAVTTKDLRAMAAGRFFREDLRYQLEGLSLPLRDRKEDIPPLAESFIQKVNRNNRKRLRGVSTAAMELLVRYAWPGNVRELETCIARAAILTAGNTLDIQDLREILRSFRGTQLHRAEVGKIGSDG